MIDIEKWEKENSEEISEANKYIFDTIRKGSSPSLLDLSPSFREILKDNTYGYWSPPNETTDLKNPARRLAATLTTAFSPEVILVPLNYHISTKNEFINLYGLNKEYGIIYEDFLNLVKTGRILLYIPSSPSSYKSSYYQEIFKYCMECEQQSYLPPQYPVMFSVVTMFNNLIQELGPNLNEKTLDEALRKEKLKIEYWQKLNKNIMDKCIPDLPKDEVELHSKGMGTDACELYNSGFSDLVDFIYEKLINKPRLIEIVLRYYNYYLVKGYSDGLGGLRFYTPHDIERMSFFRLIPRKEHEELQRLIQCSPAAATVVTNPLDSILISEPDHGEIERAMKRNPDSEMKKELLSLQHSIHDCNLMNLISKSRSINEIVTERLNQETNDHFRNSKLIKSGVRIGGTFGLDLALEAASATISAGAIPFGLSSILGIAIEETFLGKQLNHFGRCLAKKWAFRDKGLPSVIWDISSDVEK